MARETNRIQVEIMGDRYLLRSEASPDHIRRIAEDVNQRIQEVSNRYSQIPLTKVAVLVAVNLADELQRLQENYDSLVKMIETERVK